MAMREKEIRILLSYHRLNIDWRDFFVEQLKPFQEKGQLYIFDDKVTDASQTFEANQNDLSSFNIIILFISKKYISLKNFVGKEIPEKILPLQERGIRVIPLYLEDCFWQSISWLSKMKLWPSPQLPFSNMSENEKKERILGFIEDMLLEFARVEVKNNAEEANVGDENSADENSNDMYAKVVIEQHKFQSAFREFLIKEKGVPLDVLGPTHRTVKGITLNLMMISDGGNDTVAIVNFSPAKSKRELDKANERVWEYRKSSNLENCPTYIVCAAKKNREYPFDIYQVTNSTVAAYISCEDFPTFKELKKIAGDKRSTGDVTSESDEPSLDSDSSGFKKLCEALDPISRHIVERGKQIALSDTENPIPTLTTSYLIFAMLESVESKDVHCETLDFLFKKIPGSNALGKVEIVRKEYVKSLKRNYGIAVTEKAKRSDPYVTNYVVDVLKLAAKYAARTIHSKAVSCRHLLAALITYKPEGREAGALKRLRELGISIEVVLKGYPSLSRSQLKVV